MAAKKGTNFELLGLKNELLQKEKAYNKAEKNSKEYDELAKEIKNLREYKIPASEERNVRLDDNGELVEVGASTFNKLAANDSKGEGFLLKHGLLYYRPAETDGEEYLVYDNIQPGAIGQYGSPMYHCFYFCPIYDVANSRDNDDSKARQFNPFVCGYTTIDWEDTMLDWKRRYLDTLSARDFKATQVALRLGFSGMQLGALGMWGALYKQNVRRATINDWDDPRKYGYVTEKLRDGVAVAYSDCWMHALRYLNWAADGHEGTINASGELSWLNTGMRGSHYSNDHIKNKSKQQRQTNLDYRTWLFQPLRDPATFARSTYYKDYDVEKGLMGMYDYAVEMKKNEIAGGNLWYFLFDDGGNNVTGSHGNDTSYYWTIEPDDFARAAFLISSGIWYKERLFGGENVKDQFTMKGWGNL